MLLHSGSTDRGFETGADDLVGTGFPAVRDRTNAHTVRDPHDRSSAAPSGYRPSGFDLRSFAAVAGIHAVVIAGLLTIGVVANRSEPVPLVQSFNVPLPASEPEPFEPAPVPESVPETAQAVPAAAPQSPVAPAPRIALTRAAAPVMAAPLAPVRLPPAPVAVSLPVAAAAPPAPPAPAPVSPPDVAAAQRSNPAPKYPFISRRAREEGTVLLRVLVNAAGLVDDLQVSTGSRSSRLDQAAMTAVRKWRFEPARQSGRAVPAWVIVPITFSLDG